MAVSIPKMELESLTKFQRDIHVVSSREEEIISHFFRVFTKCFWYSTALTKHKAHVVNVDEVIYTANATYHFLAYSYMCFTTPAVRIKNEYKGKVRIAWPRNLGTNVSRSASFCVDETEYHWWDSIWADIFFQFFQDKGAGKRRAHNIGIGNVKCMEEWSEFLPPYDIDVYQPWFYGMYTWTAFPIFCCSSMSKIEHRYRFRRKLRQLLRMQIKQPDGTWKDSVSQIMRYLDNAPESQIPLPQLWGRYAYLTNQEIEWFKCREERYYYIRSVVPCDALNSCGYGSKPSVNWECNNPCAAFFWVAENVTARNMHNFSNYTTDSNDLYSGWDPIKNATLAYGSDTKRFHKLPSHHSSIAEARKHFKSAPDMRGYHGHSLAWNCMNYDGDIGLVPKQLKMTFSCMLADTNIFSLTNTKPDDVEDETDLEDTGVPQEEETEEEIVESKSQDKFDLKVRLLVVRKFTITREGGLGDDSVKMRLEVL